MYKRLLTFLMLFAVSPVNLFADDTAGNASMSGALAINPGAGTADCSFDVLGTESGLVRFNARFTPKRYTVTYATDSYGSGTGVSDGDIIFEEDTYTVKAEGAGTGLSGITSNVGYHFVNWLGSSDDTEYTQGTTYNSGHEFNPYNIAGDLTLTAQHAANDTTITYSCTAPANASSTLGGTVPGNDTFTYGNSEQFAGASCTLDGYELTSWSCTPDANNSSATGLASSYTPGQTVNPWSYTGSHGGTVSCDAQWTAIDYTISYDCGKSRHNVAATGNPSSSNLNIGDKYTLADKKECALSGYTFAGWDCPKLPGTATAGTTSQYFASGATGTYNYAGDVKCTAKWTPKQHKIKYDCGSIGSKKVTSGAAPDEQNVKYDSDYILAPNKNTCAAVGHSFVGWNCNYNIDEGTNENTEYPATNGVVTQTGIFRVDADVQCHAKWSTGTYSVFYKPGDSGTIEENQDAFTDTASFGSLYTVKQHGTVKITAKTGYRFYKWKGNLTPTGGDQPEEDRYYTANQQFTYGIEGDLTLTAQWTPNNGTVEYNCGVLGGTAPDSASVYTGIPVNVSGVKGKTFSLPENAPKCTNAGNYTLWGWVCDHNMYTGDKDKTKYEKQPESIMIKNDGDVIKCTALWDANLYILTYNKGGYGKYTGPTGVPVTVTKSYNTSHDLYNSETAKIEAINDGYKFNGWKCGNETTLRQPGSAYVIKNDVTCTAQWSPKSYEISYNSNGGSGSMPKTSANYKQQNVLLDPNKFTYDKHLFTGWNCVADEGGAAVSVTSSTNNNVTTYKIDEMPASNITCFAQWNQYTVTYFGCVDSFETCTGENQKGLSSYFEDRTKYAPGDDVKYPTAIELGKMSGFKGYTFDGKWYLTKSSNYPAGLSTSGRSVNLILYTMMKTLYSVNYKCDKNGDATGEDKIYTKDSVVKTKKNICGKQEGYEFVEWDCDNGVGKVAAEGNFIMPPNDVICTARIEPSVYTLIYDCGNNKQILHNDNALTMGKPVDLIDYAKCQNTGYDLTGWDCKKDNVSGDSVVYVTETLPEEDGKTKYSITMPANDVTCTAQTIKQQYTLSYECENADNNSPAAPKSQTDDYLENLPLEQNTCVKTGSTFTVWGCSDNKTYKPGEQIVLKADTVCKSQWNTDKYKVTYKCGDDGEVVTGNPLTDNEQYTYGESVTTKSIGTCQKTGNQFTKWKCGDAEVVAGGSFGITQDTTCTAQWSNKTYELTYKHGLQGTGEDNVIDIEYGTEHNILTAEAAGMTPNTGYEFDVWNCSSPFGNKNPVSTITMPARAVTCTAKWKLIGYKIHYASGNESVTGSMADTSANYGQQNVLLRANGFTYDKHFFTGWNCVADEGGAAVSVTSSTNNNVTTYKIDEMPASDVTCTAQWKQYTITYYGCVNSFETCTDANQKELSSYFENVNSDEDRTKYAPGNDVNYPTAIELSELSDFKGYTFDGKWYLTRSSDYPAGLSTNGRNVSLILYTVMLQDQYTITYKPGQAGERTVSGEDEVRRVVYGGTQYIEPVGADLKTLAANTFLITGYSFDKWMSDKDVATGDSTISPYTEYDANVSIDPYNVVGNTEMIAKWKPNHYTVTYIIGEHAQDELTFIDTYDENTQSGGATYDARYDIIVEANTAAEPIKGYEFVGWTTDSTPSFTNGALNNQWNGETIWTRDNDLTVYAAYKPRSYNISYDCGTRTENSIASVTGVPPAPQNVEYMGQYKLAENENKCVLPGAYFIGWRCGYDLDNGYSMGATYLITQGGDTVEKTGSFIIDDDVTCSALWYDYQYNVTYDCNGAAEGSVAPTDDASYYYMHNAQAKDNLVNGNPACVRKNYDFDGWNCGGVDVNVGASFVITQDTTCDAQWTYMCCDADAGQYLDTETGTCETKPEHSHLIDNMCSEGYECDMGYKLTDDGYCEIDEVEIDFDCGHGISRANEGVYGTTKTAPGEELCCDDDYYGYYCKVHGWNCDNGEQYDVGDDVAFLDGENLTCFADIEFNIRYKVYMTNDGVNWNEVNQVLVGGDTVNVSDLQPDKYRLDVHVAYPQISLQGYTFEGWYDYFDGESFDDKDRVTETPDSNYKGELWIYGKLVKRAPCVINYHNVDGATNNSNVSTYMVDGGAVNLNPATKQYYRFNGWHLGSPNGQVVDQIVPDGSTCGIDLYAEWEFECNEKGHEHWLHVGDSENDKICLYENRPYQNAAIVVVKGTSSDMNYYMMLSNDRNTLMHEGSNKKLRVMHNGTPYNACDMSTCAP